MENNLLKSVMDLEAIKSDRKEVFGDVIEARKQGVKFTCVCGEELVVWHPQVAFAVFQGAKVPVSCHKCKANLSVSKRMIVEKPPVAVPKLQVVSK